MTARAFEPARRPPRAASGILRAAIAAAVVLAAAPIGRTAPGTRVVPDRDGVDLSWMAVRDAGVGFKEPPGTQNRFLAVEGTGSSFGYAYLPWARELFPPWRFEVTAGLPFSERSQGTGDAAFGIEIVTDAEEPLTWMVQARRNGDGLDVSALGLLGMSLGSKTYSPETAVDLAIEHDGSQMKFYARSEGAQSYDLLGTAFEIPGEAVFPVMSVYEIASPGVVAFDSFRITGLAETPGALPGVDALHVTLDGAMAALHSLDRVPLDRNTARTTYEELGNTLRAALPDLSGRAKKKAKLASKDARAVAKDLGRTRPVSKIVRKARALVAHTNAARLAVGDL